MKVLSFILSPTMSPVTGGAGEGFVALEIRADNPSAAPTHLEMLW